MAKNFMSTILDELMGRDRNALPDEQQKTVSWDDPEMCSHYLVSFCPHELFVNTKADLGPCPKLHDEQLRKKYQEEAPNNRKMQFENEFIRFAEKMVQDIEAKIKRGKMRIALANGPDGGTYAGPGSINAEKIALLTERINALLKEAEDAGCEGEVEKAQGLLKLCDQLKEEREHMKSNEVSHPWNPDKAMQVCEVCGSYLIIGEAQHRLDDHIMGKQHMGFAMLRKTMDDVKKAKDIREKDERERFEKERRERRYGGRDVSAGRRESEKKDRKDKSRSRSRDRKKKDDKEKRKKSRSRSPRRRSRSKDKKDKERDKDRRSSKDERKKDRDSSRDRKDKRRKDSDDRKRKRSRSKSRDRSHRRKSKSRSRSRDRGRNRDKDRSHSSRRHREKKEDKAQDPVVKQDGDKVEPINDAALETQATLAKDSSPVDDSKNSTLSPKLESDDTIEKTEVVTAAEVTADPVPSHSKLELESEPEPVSQVQAEDRQEGDQSEKSSSPEQSD